MKTKKHKDKKKKEQGTVQVKDETILANGSAKNGKVTKMAAANQMVTSMVAAPTTEPRPLSA